MLSQMFFQTVGKKRVLFSITQPGWFLAGNANDGLSSLTEMDRLQRASPLSHGLLRPQSKKGISFSPFDKGKMAQEVKVLCLKLHFTAGVIKANERVVF